MATLTPVIVPAKVLKNGKHKLRIAVAHNGQTRYIVTDIILDKQSELKNGVVRSRGDASYLNTKLRGIVQDLQEKIDDTSSINCMSCSELISTLKDKDTLKNPTLQELFECFKMSCSAKESSIMAYEYAWTSLCRHINKNMLAAHVTFQVLNKLQASLKKAGYSNNSQCLLIGMLRSVLNYGRRAGSVSFQSDPFLGIKYPIKEVRDSWLTVEEIKALRDYTTKSKPRMLCRDLIMLSYYLGGINIVDLLDINFNDNKDVLRYQRRKTKGRTDQWVEFEPPVEAKEIIDRLIGKDGYLKIKYSVPANEKKSPLNRLFCYHLPIMARELGFKTLIYYSARKSFSQHALELGVQTYVIDYILGHSLKKGGSSLYSYLKGVPDMATKAIRLVLDNLK